MCGLESVNEKEVLFYERIESSDMAKVTYKCSGMIDTPRKRYKNEGKGVIGKEVMSITSVKNGN